MNILFSFKSICQGDFSIEELQRLYRAVCCGTLLHRRCFQEMRARTSSCAACRFDHEPDNSRALELPEDDLESLIGNLDELPSFTMEGDTETDYTRAEEALWLYRDLGRPFQTHHPRVDSWHYAPFPINPITWFTYYVLLRDLISFLRSQEFVERPTVYIHASVVCPFSVIHHAMFRYQLYDFFMFNTPSELYTCIRSIKFRLFFMSTTAVPRQEIFVEHLRYETHYSNPLYYDLMCEQ